MADFRGGISSDPLILLLPKCLRRISRCVGQLPTFLLTMLIESAALVLSGNEFQTVGAEILNAHFSLSLF